MNVLLIAQVFPPRRGGTGRWMWELYRRATGIGVQVAAGAADGAAAFDAGAALPITRVALEFPDWGLLGASPLSRYIRAYRQVAALARRTSAEAIHCAKCLPEGLLGRLLHARTGVPYWVYVHGEELTLAATSTELRWLTRVVLARAARVVANSHFTAALLRNVWGVSENRLTVMHPGVDTDMFVPAEPDAGARAALGWSARRVVLTVGALQQRKGQDTMIRALPAIRRTCPDVLYAIAGEGWERPRLEALARELGVTDLVQFRDAPDDRELVTCYQQCDLFVLPNRQVGWDVEGFGIVLAEAQACGTPVVAGESGGTRDTLQPGVTGVLVDARDPERLAEVVAALLADPPGRRRMGEAARSWAVEQFDWAALAASASRLMTLPSDVTVENEAAVLP